VIVKRQTEVLNYKACSILSAKICGISISVICEKKEKKFLAELRRLFRRVTQKED